MKKSNPKNVFTLTTQTTSPTSDEESIAKVLDWFSRSTDRSDWLSSAGGMDVRKGSDQHTVVSKSTCEDSLPSDDGGTSGLLQKKIDEAKVLRATHRSASTELLNIEEPEQQVYVPHLKSVWERHKIGTKIFVIKSMTAKNKGQPPAYPSADRREGYKADMTSEPGRYIREGPYGVPQTGTEYTLHSGISQDGQSPNVSSRNYHKYSDAGSRVADRRVSDGGGVNVTKHRQEIRIQPRQSAEAESPSKSHPRPDRVSQSTEIQLRDEPSRAPKSDADLQARYGTASYSRNRPYMDYPQGGNDASTVLKTQTRRSSYRDVSWSSEVQPSASSARNADTADTDGEYGPHRSDQDLPHQESSVDKLKSFWERERKPTFYGGNIGRGPSQSRVSKRFTKSEYDLSSLGNDDDGEANNPNVTDSRAEAANLGAGRSQFKSLRDFWDEATSGKPKSTVRKEPIKTQLTAKDFKSKEPEIHPKTRPLATKLSPHQRMSTIDSTRDISRHGTPGKENRPHRSRRDSFETSSSRTNSMRRAASMFALSAPDDIDRVQMDAGPPPLQSRNPRQNSQKTVARKPSETAEAAAPLARAYIPRDYRHYLGMTDEASFQPSLAPNPKDGEEKDGFDLGDPVRVSTPVSSEEWHGRASAKISQRPLWANYSSDTGPDSSLSSTSDSWSNSKSNFNREHSISVIHGILYLKPRYKLINHISS